MLPYYGVITDEHLEGLAKSSTGLPFYDKDGHHIGNIIRSWVEDHTLKIEVNIAQDARPRITGSIYYQHAIFEMLRAHSEVCIPKEDVDRGKAAGYDTSANLHLERVFKEPL